MFGIVHFLSMTTNSACNPFGLDCEGACWGTSMNNSDQNIASGIVAHGSKWEACTAKLIDSKPPVVAEQ